jgi:hypothetical protein
MAILRPFLAIFANCMFILHKTVVQTVILRCLTGLHLDWFKRYGLSLANSQKMATDKWPFYDPIWPFSANCMFIVNKTEVQMVYKICSILAEY